MAATNRAYKAAKRQRRKMSLPEVLLWQRLRRTPWGIRFRRQHPIGPYVLDFYCAAGRLAIEIDGIAHDMGDRPESDAVRTAWLEAQGLRVLRVPAGDVLRDPDAIAQALVSLCQNPSTPRSAGGPPPHSLRERGGSN
jgi:very-short-patch-repair endonuclease